MLALPPRMNKCLPRLNTSSTTWPVRSTAANSGTRTSHRVSAFPARASRRMVAVCQTVSPSGIACLRPLQRKLPQPFGIRGIECVGRDTALAGLAAAIDAHSLVAVLEVATADTLHQRGGGEQHRSGRALLDSLEVGTRRPERL